VRPEDMKREISKMPVPSSVAVLVLAGLGIASVLPTATAAAGPVREDSLQRVTKPHVIGAFRRSRRADDRIPAVVLGRVHVRLQAARSRRVVKAVTGGSSQDLYVAPSADGRMICLTANNSRGETRFACSPPSSFASGIGFGVLISNDGPPNAPTGLEIVGVASSRIEVIRIQFGNVTREVPVNADGGFWFVADREALARKRPTSIASLDRAGHIVGAVRGPTG